MLCALVVVEAMAPILIAVATSVVYALLYYVLIRYIAIRKKRRDYRLIQAADHYVDRRRIEYTIRELLGGGAVYRAQHAATGCMLVVKAEPDYWYGPTYTVEINETDFYQPSDDGNIYQHTLYEYTISPALLEMHKRVTIQYHDSNEQPWGTPSIHSSCLSQLDRFDIELIESTFRNRLSLARDL